MDNGVLSAMGGVKYIPFYVLAAIMLISVFSVVITFMLKHKNAPASTHRIMTAGRFIALGFASLVLMGSLLLYLPITHKDGAHISYTDSLFTSTSAVCVTGLVAFDTGDTFNILGQAIIAVLIQIGGLGIASLGIGIIALSGRKLNMRDRYLVKEALNYQSFNGIRGLVKWVLCTTGIIELIGAIASFFVFKKDYSFAKAVWLSIFHSIASFNNAGFDILGGGKSLADYTDHVGMNIITSALIVLGGIGFYTIKEIIRKRSFRRLSLNSKVSLAATASLLIIGTLAFMLCEQISLLSAFFTSVSTRTAGFQTVNIGGFSSAGILAVIVLMFIGACPGSTGGGVKTTTFFVLLSSVISIMTNRDMGAFKRKFKQDTVFKAFLIFVTSILVCVISCFLLCITEPDIDFLKILFETVSAFGTVGLTTGITSGISSAGKVILILTMFIGRIGPITAVTLLAVSPAPSVSRAEESVAIG